MLARLSGSSDIRNAILRRLLPADLEYMSPFLERIPLKERTLLQQPQSRIANVYFIEQGLVSLKTLAAGSMVETATVDYRGAVGFSVALGAIQSVYRSAVLAPGIAIRISDDNLRRCMEERAGIRSSMLRFVDSFIVHSSQQALCGMRHDLEPRLSRWICLACDALNRNTLAITHDQLSEILGCRRATVTKTLLALEEQALVEKTRGALQLRDRELLRLKACCCYRIVSEAYQAKTPAD